MSLFTSCCLKEADNITEHFIMSWFTVSQGEYKSSPVWLSRLLYIAPLHVLFRVIILHSRRSAGSHPLTHELITQVWFQVWQWWHATKVWDWTKTTTASSHTNNLQTYLHCDCWVSLPGSLSLPQAIHVFSCSVACQTEGWHCNIPIHRCLSFVRAQQLFVTQIVTWEAWYVSLKEKDYTETTKTKTEA